METFCLPLHELYERFTKSEMVMMAWRSQEQHHHLKERMKRVEKGDRGYSYTSKGRRYGANEIIPEGLPEHFYDEHGDINLSKVTGKEALKYMAAIGMPFPVMQARRKNAGPDEKAASPSNTGQ